MYIPDRRGRLLLERSRIFLGVDGGSSGTRALLIDCSGKALGLGLSGKANHSPIGYDTAVANVMAAVGQAVYAAGIALTDLDGAFFALAGDDVQDDHDALLNHLVPAMQGIPLELANDVWAGLRAGSIEGAGIAVNCGSGAGGVGKNAAGVRHMIADLGYIFGDSGGGEQIAIDAVRAVIRAWDGRGSSTALTQAILSLTSLPTVDDLYLYLYRGKLDRSLTRQVTRLVFMLAAQGDAVAGAILRRIGDEFGVTACAIARRLGMVDQSFDFVLTGGAIRTLGSPLVEAAVSRLRSVAPGCRPTLPRLMPVGGAALLALDRAGVPVSAGHFEYLVSQGHGWHPEETFV
jgi:N-acetylglucosamine kinase-like BadF-type ATPase